MHLNFWHLNMLNHSKTHVQLLWVTNKWFIRISRWKEGHNIIWSLICKKNNIFWVTHHLWDEIFYSTLLLLHGPLFQTRKYLIKLIHEMIWFGLRNFKTFFFSIQNHSLMVVVNCDTQKNSRFLDQVDLHKNWFQFPLHFPQHWFNTTLILKGEPYHILPTFHKKI